MSYPQSYKRLLIFHFSTYILSADITPDMLKLCRVTKVKVLFLVLVFFNFNLFEFPAAILEKGVLTVLAEKQGICKCIFFIHIFITTRKKYSDKK